MEIKGKIVEIFDSVQVSDKFRKREFVVEYAENAQYPEYIKFELTQDKCDLLNSFKPGQLVEVSFNLKGRRWSDPKGEVKYFNSLQAWKLQNADGGQQDTAQPFVSREQDSWGDDSDNGGLPF